MTTTQNTNNDIAELVALLPENLVERYPNAEQRIYWMRDNYGVTLKMAFQANKIISAI
jgi:predicted 3-demethylubiquinone-9 3-methyltransferase (glyoxalase superfamily)